MGDSSLGQVCPNSSVLRQTGGHRRADWRQRPHACPVAPHAKGPHTSAPTRVYTMRAQSCITHQRQQQCEKFKQGQRYSTGGVWWDRGGPPRGEEGVTCGERDLDTEIRVEMQLYRALMELEPLGLGSGPLDTVQEKLGHRSCSVTRCV